MAIGVAVGASSRVGVAGIGVTTPAGNLLVLVALGVARNLFKGVVTTWVGVGSDSAQATKVSIKSHITNKHCLIFNRIKTLSNQIKNLPNTREQILLRSLSRQM